MLVGAARGTDVWHRWTDTRIGPAAQTARAAPGWCKAGSSSRGPRPAPPRAPDPLSSAHLAPQSAPHFPRATRSATCQTVWSQHPIPAARLAPQSPASRSRPTAPHLPRLGHTDTPSRTFVASTLPLMCVLANASSAFCPWLAARRVTTTGPAPACPLLSLVARAAPSNTPRQAPPQAPCLRRRVGGSAQARITPVTPGSRARPRPALLARPRLDPSAWPLLAPLVRPRTFVPRGQPRARWYGSGSIPPRSRPPVSPAPPPRARARSRLPTLPHDHPRPGLGPLRLTCPDPAARTFARAPLSLAQLYALPLTCVLVNASFCLLPSASGSPRHRHRARPGMLPALARCACCPA